MTQIDTAIIKNMITDDPFVYNLFANDTKHDFEIGRSINWIKIPTSFLSENGKDSSISLMSVNTYSGDECAQIKKSISNPSDIVFTNDGHVAVNFEQKGTEAQFFYPNPMITKNTGGSTGSRPIGMSNTVAMKNTNFGPSFFHNDKILFSQNLKWILYKLPASYYYYSNTANKWMFTQNNTGKDTIPVYVLLYNTIHRKNFQDIYAKIINLSNNPFSTQSFMGPNTNYMTTIKKYCNAFRVKKYDSPNTGEELDHYADPACALAFDTEIAKLSQTLSLNLTAETWKKNFYPGGQAGFTAAIQDLAAVPSSDAYCSRGSGGGPSRFLREKAKVMEANTESDSFMQILANYQILSSAEESGASLSDWNPQRPGDSTKGAVCGSKPVSFVDCSVTISTYGDLDLNNNNVRPVCGNNQASSSNEVQDDVSDEVQDDISDEVQDDISVEVQGDISVEVQGDIAAEVQDNVPEEEQDGAPEEEQDGAPEEEQDGAPEEEPVVTTDQQGLDIYNYIYIIIAVLIVLLIGLYFIL